MARTRKDSTVGEMKEFAGFESDEQRYILRSLEINTVIRYNRGTIDSVIEVYARSDEEEYAIKAQTALYQAMVSTDYSVCKEYEHSYAKLMPPLLIASSFDLGQYCLHSFSSYRYLYERLLGVLVRPILISTFLFAAGQPRIKPKTRKKLMQSLSEAAMTAPGWSDRECKFFPEWVEDVEYVPEQDD